MCRGGCAIAPSSCMSTSGWNSAGSSKKAPGRTRRTPAPNASGSYGPSSEAGRWALTDPSVAAIHPADRPARVRQSKVGVPARWVLRVSIARGMPRRQGCSGLRGREELSKGAVRGGERCMVGTQILGSPNKSVLSHPYLIAAARLPPPGAIHTGTGVLRAPTGDELVVPSGQARRHMAPWTAKRGHHGPRGGKPKGEVRAVAAGGDCRVGEV